MPRLCDDRSATCPAPNVRASQGFNWESCKSKWYNVLSDQAAQIAAAGYTAVWLPPPSDAVSPQGYLPRDLYVLDSAYGTESELRHCIKELKRHNLKVIADIVINHRCAHKQVPHLWRSLMDGSRGSACTSASTASLSSLLLSLTREHSLGPYCRACCWWGVSGDDALCLKLTFSVYIVVLLDVWQCARKTGLW
jgi:hypothetical protein